MNTRKDLFKLVGSIMLGVLAVILSITGQLFPDTIKVQFDDTILMINGLIFGPFYAVITGIVADLMAILINGYTFFPGFTLNSILYGVIPIVLIKLFRGLKNFKYLLFVILILFFIGSSYYILTADNIASITTTNITRVIFLMITIVNIAVISVITFKTRNTEKKLSYQDSIFIVLVVALVVNIMLTPLWINMLYGTPIITSIQIRLFKAVLLLPFDAFLLYKLYNIYNNILEDRY